MEIQHLSLSYKPKEESDFNIEHMRLMDEHDTLHSFKGSERMLAWLTMDKGYPEPSSCRAIQFTSEICTQTVLLNQIKLSMDGKGGATDNGIY